MATKTCNTISEDCSNPKVNPSNNECSDNAINNRTEWNFDWKFFDSSLSGNAGLFTGGTVSSFKVKTDSTIQMQVQRMGWNKENCTNKNVLRERLRKFWKNYKIFEKILMIFQKILRNFEKIFIKFGKYLMKVLGYT